MPMSNDPYASEDRNNLAGVASNHFTVTASDVADLPVGVKALDLDNAGATSQIVKITAVNQKSQLVGDAVSYRVPAGTIRTVFIRAQKVWADGKGADITVIAYTDGNTDTI
jgi:hypothetical protein